jgi:hypothetical protein
MKTTSLAPLLAGLVASVAPLAAACGGSDPTELPESVQCSAVTGPSRYDAITASPTVDGIVFATRSTGTISGAAEGVATLVRSVGEPCARATDNTLCKAQIAAALKTPPVGGWDPTGSANFGGQPAEVDFAVVSQGDEVRVVANATELAAVIAPIDSLPEAFILAASLNKSPTCGTARAQTETGSYKLQRVSSSCNGASSWHLCAACVTAWRSSRRDPAGIVAPLRCV